MLQVWHALWSDARLSFGWKKAGLTQTEVGLLFLEKGIKPDLTWRVMPKNPHLECSLQNAAVVPRAIRRRLVSEWSKKGKDGRSRYQELVSCVRPWA